MWYILPYDNITYLVYLRSYPITGCIDMVKYIFKNTQLLVVIIKAEWDKTWWDHKK